MLLPSSGSMLVRIMKPQPPLVLRGNAGYAACTSGRAPSILTAKPTNTSARPPQCGFGPGASNCGNGSRQIATRSISRSSSAQPVIATAPVTPFCMSAGVSTTPMGGVVRPFWTVVSVTAIGPASEPAPVKVS